MNTETYNATINQLFDQARSALSPDTVSKFDEETTDELVKAEFTALMRAESKRDPEFERQVIQEVVKGEVKRYLEEHRPTGRYDADALFPISDECWIHMPVAKREDLLAWSALESDPANHRYIASRLLHWDETKYPTLEDLEKALATTD